MSRQIWLMLIASSLIACGLPANVAAQSEASQAVNSPMNPRAIPAGRFERDAVLRGMLSGKPLSPANKDSKPLTAVADPAFDIIEFDAPGASTAAYEGTEPAAINVWDEITGFYSDSSGAAHGFVRYWNGKITTFDPPGSHGTGPAAINLGGEITGTYFDANSTLHGFLRSPDGSFTTFDVPGAGTSVNQGTYPVGINDEGSITGYYCGGSTSPSPQTWCYGFVRSPEGAITTFDPSNSAYVFPAGIDDFGAATGSYSDANGMSHGFLREWGGEVVTFDPPSSKDTSSAAINPQGAIAGGYIAPENNAVGFLVRGFVRNLDGSFETFDAATYSPCCIFTFPEAINLEGAIAGYDRDGYEIDHGFVRSPNGSITTFDAPDAGAFGFQGTLAYGINLEGAITGYYIDANYVYHGFVRIKK